MFTELTPIRTYRVCVKPDSGAHDRDTPYPRPPMRLSVVRGI
jgi:hypothetical protein